PDYYTPVIVLQCSGNDLRCRCASAVDQHRNRHLIIQWCVLRFVTQVVFGNLALRTDHELSFRNKQVGNVYRFEEESARVTTKIKNYTFSSPFAKRNERVLYLAGSIRSKVTELNVCDVIANHSGKRNVIDFYFLTRKCKRYRRLRTIALHGQ